jgi:hypothetical protein
MRLFAAGFAVGLALLTMGCHLGPHVRPDDVKPTQPAKPVPSVETLVGYLNDNCQRIQGVQSHKVAIDAKDHGQSVALAGLLACQKPRSFRLKVKAAGSSQGDMGSNEQEFWYWIARAQPPYLFHCSYEALQNPQVSQRLNFPFQPDMVLAALGLGKYDEKKSYRVQDYADRSYYELIETTTSPQGQPLQKVVVFTKEQIDPRSGKPQVIAHALRDDKGNFICKAMISSVVVDPATNAILPRRISLVWPKEQLEMVLDMPDIRSASFGAEQAGRLFQRSDLASLPSYDIGRGARDDGAELQRTQATFARP